MTFDPWHTRRYILVVNCPHRTFTTRRQMYSKISTSTFLNVSLELLRSLLSLTLSFLSVTKSGLAEFTDKNPQELESWNSSADFLDSDSDISYETDDEMSSDEDVPLSLVTKSEKRSSLSKTLSATQSSVCRLP